MEMRGLLCCFATLLIAGHVFAGPAVSPTDTGVCWAMGDPHYRTFDGHFYNFMGSCSYVLAKNMDVDAKHPAFEVTAKNTKSEGSLLTSVGEVTINVYGNMIKIFRNELSMVWVNDKVWNLPVTLIFSQDEIKLRQSGLSVVLWTDFGLTVQYDWKEYVRVTVPSSFMGRVGGLCGNFDKNKNDDLINPDGSVADSIEALGKSWRVPNQKDEQDCKDECTGDCGGCSWWKRGKADVFCGVMTPVLKYQFKDCHAVIESRVFFDMCKFDYCRDGEMKDYICDMLGVYTDACQRAGVKVHDWRKVLRCSLPVCPVHSHFEYCGNACPATCEDPSAPSSCKTPCVQTCICDEGYFRSGNKCIRQEQCGCQYNDLYLKPRQSIWADGCTQKITCNSGTITSEEKSCDPGARCEVKNGISSCQAMESAVCTISGDPHYNTFDNVTYDFMGTCTYTATEGCHLDGTDLTPFTVVVENEKWINNPEFSVAKLVAVTVYGNTIILRRNQVGLVMVNGAIMNLPVNLNEGQVTIQLIGTNDVISTDFGLTVSYDLVYHVAVRVPGTYAGKTCGLCGNFNGKTDDEFRLPDGQITKDLTDFGSSWKVGVPGVVCENGCEGDNCPKCPANERTKIESDCSIITDPKGPFAACHAVIDPASYYRDCVYDVCVAERIQMLCHSINAYVIDCQDVGVKVLNWRTSSLCPLTCPTNSHYSICASACKTPCPGLTSVTCADVCAEGCACNTGYYFNGTGCVAQDECGCYINGKTLKIGETVVAADCSVRYICPKSGHGHMDTMSCTSEEMCGLQNGIRGCYLKQCIMGNNGVFTTFNGKEGDVQDSGMYDLVKICEDTAEGWFRIVMDLETCLQTGHMTAVGIIAFFDDLTVIVNSEFETSVNGKAATLPFQMRNGVSIQVTNNLLVIEKMSALVVSYSLSGQITVAVSYSVARNVCGACGQLTEDPAQAAFTKSSIQNYLDDYRSTIFNFCPQ